MAYTLLFGNNFISESPQCVKIYDKVLFVLNEDDNGPYLSTQIFDSSGENIIVKVERNVCTYYDSQELDRKHNERNYLLIDNKYGENILQSRVLDKKTILVSGIFSFKEFVLVSTQNYIVLPGGKKMMYDRVSARNGSVIIIDEGIKQEIGDIIDLLDTTVKSVRRISSELRPSLLYNLGLIAAMEWHLKEFEKRSGIKTIFNEPKEELEMSDSLKNGLFRIFQESLTNISRHANANKINVTLEQKGQQLILSIEDNGQGFEKEKIAAKETLGILGMKERSQMIGGNYEIISIPGKGTTIIVSVPYNGKNNLL